MAKDKGGNGKPWLELSILVLESGAPFAMSGIPQSTKQRLLRTLSSYYPMALNLKTHF